MDSGFLSIENGCRQLVNQTRDKSRLSLQKQFFSSDFRSAKMRAIYAAKLYSLESGYPLINCKTEDIKGNATH